MAAKKKVKLVEKPIIVEKPLTRRILNADEFEVRDIKWAVGIKCTCGHELDLFNRNQDFEMVCKKCGRGYDVELVGYERLK
jgi:hypothetical protein